MNRRLGFFLTGSGKCHDGAVFQGSGFCFKGLMSVGLGLIMDSSTEVEHQGESAPVQVMTYVHVLARARLFGRGTRRICGRLRGR
jgi:hypothetical protein